MLSLRGGKSIDAKAEYFSQSIDADLSSIGVSVYYLENVGIKENMLHI